MIPHQKEIVMDSPSKAKTASTTSKSKKRYVKPELTKISPSTAKVILQAKAGGDPGAEKMLKRINKVRLRGSQDRKNPG